MCTPPVQSVKTAFEAKVDHIATNKDSTNTRTEHTALTQLFDGQCYASGSRVIPFCSATNLN